MTVTLHSETTLGVVRDCAIVEMLVASGCVMSEGAGHSHGLGNCSDGDNHAALVAFGPIGSLERLHLPHLDEQKNPLPQK